MIQIRFPVTSKASSGGEKSAWDQVRYSTASGTSCTEPFTTRRL
jgi:hypothetical protein